MHSSYRIVVRLIAFLEFQPCIERKTDVFLRQVHSDDSKEYKAMGKHLRQEVIIQTFSSVYTQKSNGFSEHFNRTILDKARSMLQESGIKIHFWTEAALHAVYLTNVTGSKANQGKTLYQLLLGVKSKIKKTANLWLRGIFRPT